MLTALTIAGGVALILFGVRFLRKGLDRLFGPKLGTWTQRLARNRLRAFLTGMGVSVLAPSSTTVSLWAVSAVQAGHLSARQMFAVMLGADIGLTAIVLLISLQLDHFAPVFILVGVVLFQFFTSDRARGIGQVVLSLGFVFMSIATIKGAVQGAGANGDLQQLIAIAEHYPFILAGIATVMAVVMQSSTATIALVIALAAADKATLPLGVAIVAGANVGIAITTLVVGWRQLESRRLAFANLLAKAVVAMIFLSLLPQVVALLGHMPGDMANHMAYAHTGFNIALATLCLPLVGPITNMVAGLVPAPPASDKPVFGPRHINNAHFDSTALALGLSLKEILHVGEIVRHMLSDLWRAMEIDNADLARRVAQMDDRIDLLDSEIKRFLTRALRIDGDARDSAEQMRQLRYLVELETIGDIIDKNLSELVLKKIKLKVNFSREGREELEDFYRKVSENLLIADTAFTTGDKALAQRLLDHKEAIGALDRELRDRHFARLNAGLAESHETSAIHLDLLTHLKRINSHVSHVAYATLMQE